jgi:hypothetical protein
MENSERQLIQDIENLLNGYEGLQKSYINPELLSHLDEASLKEIISDLLMQKENAVSSNLEYLQQFKNTTSTK